MVLGLVSAEGPARHRCYALNGPSQRNSLLQGIWQGNFSESQVTATIPAGLAQPRQRGAANSLRLRGREFFRPAQGNVSRLAGNSKRRIANRRQRRNSNVGANGPNVP